MFKKKRAVKYKYKITFVSASGIDDGSFVHISWKRGSKSANHGETESNEAVGGNVDWNESVSILCTLFTASGTATGYEPKELLLTLTTFNLEKKKDVILGKLVVDLGAFADAKEPQTKYHNVKPLKKGCGGPFVLVVTYATEPLNGSAATEEEATSETDAGIDDVSEGEDEPAEDAAAAAVATAAEPAAAASPAKKGKSKKSKKSSSSAALVVNPPKSSGGTDEKLADVIKERDELRVTVENLKKKNSKRRGSDASAADLVDVEALQQQLAVLRTDNMQKEQELSETREALALKIAEEGRMAEGNKESEAQLQKFRVGIKDSNPPGDNATLIAALEARVASLEADRERLRKDIETQCERNKGETRALRNRVNEAEKALDRAGSSSRMKSKGEVELLQKQNAQLSKRWDVLTELFDSISHARYSASGKPMTAMLITDFLRKGGQPDDSAVFIPVTSAIKLALSAPVSEYQIPLLWVSTLLCVLQDMGQSVATIPAMETLPPGEGKTACEILTRLLVRAFIKTLETVYNVIEPACHASFIAATAGSSAAPDSQHGVVAILAAVSNAAKDAHLPPSVRKQLITQIVYDIDATVFNELVKDESLCTCDRVFKIRKAMSAVESWLLKDSEIASAKRQLQRIREVANLFAMDKTILTDDEAIHAAFSALNIPQLARLLEYYHPDDLNKLTVDPDLIRDMKVKALEVADSAPIEVDGHQWYNLPKAQDK